jgi:cell division septal protein FtsQ
MLNSISSLKKITLLIYFLIFSSSIFLIWQMLSRADLPIKEIMIKGQYDSIDSEQIHLIANKYLIGNFFTINLKSTQNALKSYHG